MVEGGFGEGWDGMGWDEIVDGGVGVQVRLS